MIVLVTFLRNLGSVCDGSRSLIFGWLCVLESRSWKPGSRSLAKSRIYHSIPLIVVCELESGKNKKDERETGERTVPSLSPHAQTPRCFFCMLTSLCPAFPQSERLEKIARRFFPLDFFTLTPNREPVHRLPGKRKWTLNRIWVVCYFSFKLIEWLAGWPWEARASVPPISRCWSRELAFARRKKRGRL